MMHNNPFIGANALLRGLSLLTRPGLRRFVVVPLLINVLLFAGGLWYATDRIGTLVAWLQDRLPGWLQWIEWLLWPLFIISAVLLVFYAFSLAANLIAAPFNSLLAERVEVYLTGEPTTETGGWRKALAEVIPAFASELRKLLYLALRAVPLLLLFVIPGVNLVAPFLWLAFSAWMLAVEYADYPMGNHGLDFRALRRRLG